MSFVDGSKTKGGKAYRQKESLKDLVKWRDNFTCQICGWSYPDVTIEVDHIIPWAISHNSTPDNLQVLCVECNRLTRRPRYDASLPLDEYYQQFEDELITSTLAVTMT